MTKKILEYSFGSKFFHWIIALIVISMLSFSFFLDDISEHYRSSAFMLHKSFGLTVLFLMIARYIWIIHSGKPDLPASTPIWEKILARGVQYSLYILLIFQPLCGWVMSVAANRVPSYFGLFNMPLPIEKSEALSKLMKQFHNTIAWVLVALVLLHIAGALKHHFINKDNVLKQMI